MLLHDGHVSKGFLGFLSDGGVVLQHHDLWQIAYTGVVRNVDSTSRRLLLSVQYLQQRRLASAILSHQGYTVTVVHHETRIGKQGFDAKLYAQ